MALVLIYALPLFVPPAAVPSTTAAADAPLITRLFPQVPGWWITGRLLALLVGATLVAAAAREPAVRLRGLQTSSGRRGWRRPWVPLLALLAAGAQAASLPWRATFSPIGQTLFMVWFAVPAALLAWGMTPRGTAQTARRRWSALTASWPVWAVIAVWLVCRTVVSWHSPRAADVVDMWRVFGGFVQLAGSGGSFLTGALDPELPGLTATLLFFQGFPLLQLVSRVPDLTWVQVANAGWLAVSAALVAALAATLISRSVAVIAAAAFLFSPFTLVFQLSPMPSIQLLVPALVGLLLVGIYRTGSPPALALLGSVVGISAGMPPLVGMSGLAVLLAAWRVWRRPGTSRIVITTAIVSLLTGLLANLPSPAAIGAMYARYAATQIPLAVAEQAVQGQRSPTIEDWLGGPLPEGVPLERLAEYRIPVTRGRLLVPLGTLLAPFAIPRWPLRLWGDTLFDPFSAGLAAVGLAVCARHARRDRVSRVVLLCLAAALLPGFVSSYDRASVLRLFGAPVPVALLAAAGLQSLLRTMTGRAARRWALVVASIALPVSGMVIFDVVNPRILAASSLGLLARSVDEADLGRVALLTSYGRDARPGVPPGRRYWELDWLRHHHPYIQEILRCVPTRPIPLAALERLGDWNAEQPEYPVVFWSPALEQAAGVTDQLCQRWPAAALYTIVDASGLSRLYAARLADGDWAPAMPRAQWTVSGCPQPRSRSPDTYDVASVPVG